MASTERYKNLMNAGKIGGLTLRNRIVMAGMGTNLGESDGTCSERIQAYYEARAKGGAGLIIMGVGAIAYPEGTAIPNQVGLSDDRFLPGLTAMADRIHRHGAKIAIQLQHAGKVAVCDIAEGRPQLVPSIPKFSETDMMEALTQDEMGRYINSFMKEGAKVAYKEADKGNITRLIEHFVAASVRLEKAGFDGVEIHCAHGYIISAFLSPYANHREDEYGGPIENRARLMQEVVAAIKKSVKSDFGVWVRIDAKEFRTPGGITLEDAKRTAVLAEQAGADAVHVSAYADPMVGAAFTEAPLVHQEMGFAEFAHEIKRQVSVPVIAVGRIEPDAANTLVRDGKADFIAMARKLLADPDLPCKLAEGREAEIRPCIYCYICVSQIFFSAPVKCAVNAYTGLEYDKAITPAPQNKTIVVIGGGPGGMEAARVARLRGHRVILFERDKHLGGTVRIGAIAYEPNGRLLKYLIGEMHRLDIEIHLATEATPETVNALKPDHVVVATGATRMRSQIPGSDASYVLDGSDLHALFQGGGGRKVTKLNPFKRGLVRLAAVTGMMNDPGRVRSLSHLWLPLGRRVIIIGGGLVGLELAEFLVERGRKVSVLYDEKKPGIGLSVVRRWRVLNEIKEAGAPLIPVSEIKAIKKSRVIYQSMDANEGSIDFDTVIIAQGLSENLDLVDQLESHGLNVSIVGDSKGLGFIDGAIHDGARVAEVL